MKTRVLDSGDFYFDFSRQLFSDDEYKNLLDEMEMVVKPKMERMLKGEKINFTENRAVGHISLRATEEDFYYKKEVIDVLNSIHEFVEEVHNGKWLSATGKKIKNIISIGIGGSYLGIEFFYKAMEDKKKMDLRLLSNIDPFNFHECISGINADETIIIVISKTFTTQETMINAFSIKEWLLKEIKGIEQEEIIKKHMIAVSSEVEKAKQFGITKVFGFWDWVGGRYSVWSAVGMLPLGLTFGFDCVESILDGARNADHHFFNKPFHSNIPIHMGLITIDHIKRGFNCRAILPYSQALSRFPAHIQQVEMESNGKYIKENGEITKQPTGQVVFGEPGTNGQHSFYQLLHQGTQIIPCEFIAFCKQTNNFTRTNATLSNHDELMCNLFAQADALFFGKSKEEVLREGCVPNLLPHKIFQGGRPSTVLLMKELSWYNLGYLLGLYEHYVAVEGFYMGINSFDQWGVELGKQLANKVKCYLEGDHSVKFNHSTQQMLDFYSNNK